MAEGSSFVERLVAEHGADDVIVGYLRCQGHPCVGLWSDVGGTYRGPDDHPSIRLWYLDGVDARDVVRPCPGCGLTAGAPGAPDPCLGFIDGVTAACCGHGQPEDEPYVWWGGEEDLRGDDALAWFAEYGVGPRVDHR